MVEIDTKVLDIIMGRRFMPLLRVLLVDLAGRYGIIITSDNAKTPFDCAQPINLIGLSTVKYSKKETKEILRYLNCSWQYDKRQPEKQIAKIVGAKIIIELCDLTQRRLWSR